MNTFLKIMIINFLIASCVLCSPMVVGATDQSQEVEAMRTDLKAIKVQLKELAKSVDEIKATLKALRDSSAAGIPKRVPESVAKGLSNPEIRSTVCKAIHSYIRSIDEGLRLTDGVQAQNRMERAYADLRNAINRYSVYPDVEEIISIGGDLDYDTYTDVSLRDSTEGTSAFVKSITSYKEKLKAYCSNRVR